MVTFKHADDTVGLVGDYSVLQGATMDDEHILADAKEMVKTKVLDFMKEEGYTPDGDGEFVVRAYESGTIRDVAGVSVGYKVLAKRGDVPDGRGIEVPQQ